MYDDVKEFFKKFGMQEQPLLFPSDMPREKTAERIICMQEELQEFAIAADTHDVAGMADALVDLVYFVLGTAVYMNLPWQELWDDVHRANMQKERGITKRGIPVDCVKPEGWKGPKTIEILRAHGYEN